MCSYPDSCMNKKMHIGQMALNLCFAVHRLFTETAAYYMQCLTMYRIMVGNLMKGYISLVKLIRLRDLIASLRFFLEAQRTRGAVKIMQNRKLMQLPNTPEEQSTQGIFLGVVLDLSDSMRISMRNNDSNQLSRIENLSHTFRSVLEDTKLLTHNTTKDEETRFRMFIQGFGFQSESVRTWTSPIGDVFSIFTCLEEKVNYYKLLQEELEKLWLGEFEETLEQGRVSGNAKEELQIFVEQELREQAIRAEQQRSVAKFQQQCASLCLLLDNFENKLRTRIAHSNKFAFVLIPIVACVLWLLRGPTLLVAYLNKVFEAWLQRKLVRMRTNAHKYSSQQAEKVVYLTQRALTKYQEKIARIVEQAMTSYIDKEAFKLIHLYDAKSSIQAIRKSFDRKEFRNIYKNATDQIASMMNPHANFAWEKSIFLFKRAAKALKIKPKWDILKQKTLRCAHQVVWEITKPEISVMAKTLAKERFTKAVLITIVQSVKDRETTLSLEELSKLFKYNDEIQISSKELPIFDSSPIGLALIRTFTRLRREAQLPQNKG